MLSLLTNMKTYKQIEQRFDNLFPENPSYAGYFLQGDNGMTPSPGEIKDFIKQALLDFYEEVVPEKSEHNDWCEMLQDMPEMPCDCGVEQYNQAIDQLNKAKEEFFKE